MSVLYFDRISAYWAFFLRLHPLKQAFIVKNMPTRCQFPTVQELTHTDNTILVEGSLGRSKYFVESVQQSIVASISSDS